MSRRASCKVEGAAVSDPEGSWSEWWTIGQAVAWVGSGEPLEFKDWKDDTIPPRFASHVTFGPPWFGASVSPAAGRLLISQNDGFDEALGQIIAAIKEAAAAGRVAFRGRRLRESGAPDPDARMEDVPADDFSIPSLTFCPESNSTMPGDDAIDLLKVPRWEALRIASTDMQNAFPAERDVYGWMLHWAEDFVRSKRRPPHRDDEAVFAAQRKGFPINKARAAYARLPAHLKQPARRPRRKSA